MLHFLKYILLISLLFLPLTAFSSGQPEFYKRFMSIPSDKLMTMGHEYFDKRNQPDSALVCFSIVGRRYNSGMSRQEKEQCAQAYLDIWKVYFFSEYDFNSMYDALLHARDIYADLKEENATLHLNYGVFYQTIGMQSKDSETSLKAIGYYRKAFDIAVREKDIMTYDMVFSNIVTVAYNDSALDKVKDVWEVYRKLPSDSHTPLHTFNTLLYEGMAELRAGHYDQAFAAFTRQLKVIPDNDVYARYQYMALVNSADALAHLGNYRGAVALVSKAEDLGRKYGIRDILMESYEILADYYKETGDKERSGQYLQQYYMLKDSMLSAKEMAKAKDLEFVYQMNKVNAQLDEMTIRQRASRLLLIAAAAIIIIVIGFSYKLWRKNKALNERNRYLYEQSLQGLKRTDEKKQHQASPDASETDDEIIEKVEEAFANTHEICAQTFSAERLSEMTGISYHILSKAINEHYQCNFNALLNQYRIQEACRRIAGDRSHTLNIKGLSADMGFRSRTTFNTAFKRFTGLTPGEYLKQAWGKQVPERA